MKIKSSDNIFVYFINNNMDWNIDEEHEKLIQIINDKEFDFLKFAKKNFTTYRSVRINFLWQVLKLTIKYPQIESYLKNLLNHFTDNELHRISGSTWSILHYMTNDASKISLYAFEIIINHGVNINIKNSNGNASIHILLRKRETNHNYNILNLLMKHDVNLNIINHNKVTVLDIITYCRNKLSEEDKNYIMLLVDFGARTNNPKKNNEIYDFIECYKYSTIKPAIKK